VSNWPAAVFNAMEAFKDDFRCITMDQRNANGGESTGPIPAGDPWGAFADDQLGLVDHLGNSGRDVWAPELRARRPEITMESIEAYLHDLYRVRPDFVYSVSREFVRSCQTPLLVMPDDTPAHPYQTSVDIAALALSGAHLLSETTARPRTLYCAGRSVRGVI
jgi:hypothetical protein